jgi:hypothetical protein
MLKGMGIRLNILDTKITCKQKQTLFYVSGALPNTTKVGLLQLQTL